jgi:hypothetical protein
MKKLIPAVYVLALSIAACTSGSVWTEGPFEEVKLKAAAEEKLILVDFYSPG